MNFTTLKFSMERQYVGVLEVNRPEALNALNAKVIDELAQAAEMIQSQKDLRVLILTGSGPKSFVAGADIKEMQNYSPAEARAMSDRGQAVLSRFEGLRQPVIGAVNGFALGGGLELALACDFLIAAKTAKFGLPEVTLGLIPGYGGTQRLSRSVGLNIARRIALSGEIFSAEQGEKWGLFTEVVEPADLRPRALAIAEILAERAPEALTLAKRAIREGFDLELSKGMQLEAEHFSRTFATKDHAEGISAFIEKRKPNFQGK